MKALVGAFNQEKALVRAFSVIVKTDGSSAALKMPLYSRADGEHDPLVPGEVDPVQRHQPLPGVRQPGAPREVVGVVGLAGGGVLGALPTSVLQYRLDIGS